MATFPEMDNDTFYYQIHHPHWLAWNRTPLTQGVHVTFAVVGICVFIGSFVGNLMVIIFFVR